MFFFSSRRRHTRLQGDWSSDVCSSDLPSAAHEQWWAGFSPAGRFLAPLVPIFASMMGSVVQHGGYRRAFLRSEERRVGKECGSGWSTEEVERQRGIS